MSKGCSIRYLVQSRSGSLHFLVTLATSGTGLHYIGSFNKVKSTHQKCAFTWSPPLFTSSSPSLFGLIRLYTSHVFIEGRSLCSLMPVSDCKIYGREIFHPWARCNIRAWLSKGCLVILIPGSQIVRYFMSNCYIAV